VEKPKKSALSKTEKPLIIVISTAGGLLLLLLIVITVVAFQRRRFSLGRRGRSGGAHGDDDRMSLVYYSNDVHVVLPSYDEAMQTRRLNNPPPYAQEDEHLRMQAIASDTVANGLSCTLHSSYFPVCKIAKKQSERVPFC